jgi:hypothetical protein
MLNDGDLVYCSDCCETLVKLPEHICPECKKETAKYEGEYKLKEICFGCETKNNLGKVTINETDYTLCISCEQKFITAVINGQI